MTGMRAGEPDGDRFARSADEGFRALMDELDDPPEHAAIAMTNPGTWKAEGVCTCGWVGQWRYTLVGDIGAAKALAQDDADVHMKERGDA